MIDIKSGVCRLCGSEQNKILFKKRAFLIVKCRKCSFVFAIADTDSNLNSQQIYGEEYFIGKKSQGFSDYERFRDVISRNSEYRISLIQKYRACGNLLDVGCALGFFLETARKKGWNVWGIEISDYAVVHCKNRLGLSVFANRTGDYSNLPDNLFDVITMYDLIEHVEDPVFLLREMKKKLKLDGLLVIETPDVTSFYSNILKKYSPYIRPPAHLSFFSKYTLNRALESVGLKVETIAYSKKIVNLSYLINVLEPYNKTLASLFKWVSFISGPLKDHHIKLYLGGLYAVAFKDK